VRRQKRFFQLRSDVCGPGGDAGAVERLVRQAADHEPEIAIRPLILGPLLDPDPATRAEACRQARDHALSSSEFRGDPEIRARMESCP
jgi:hypothetical protein